jgi:hypothetical protein
MCKNVMLKDKHHFNIIQLVCILNRLDWINICANDHCLCNDKSSVNFIDAFFQLKTYCYGKVI